MSDEKKQAPHLLEEPPILVYPTLAVYMGINKAVVFQQLHFLQNGQRTAQNHHNYIDGRYWVYNSYQEWKEKYFPWLSVSTLKGIFIELESEDKLIVSRQSVKNKSDRRKWYSIDYEAWVSFCTTMRQKLSDGSLDKNSPMVGQQMSDGYSETPSEKKKKAYTPKRERKPDPFYDAIAQIWKLKASGQIVSVRSMMFGTAKRGTWKDCNFDPPVTDAQEILDFGRYMTKRMADQNLTTIPTAAVTIQRWFYDFRMLRERRAKLAAKPVDPALDLSKPIEITPILMRKEETA